MDTVCSFLHYTDIHVSHIHSSFITLIYSSSWQSMGLLAVLNWGMECCGWWRKTVWEKWRAGKCLRSVCPVRLLPLHNLWAAGADHHGSVPRAAPGAAWDRPVNWMLCSCWACKGPFFFTIQPQKQTSHEPSYEPRQLPLSSAGLQISKKQEMEVRKKGSDRKNGLLSLNPWAANHFTPFLHSLPTLIDTHQPLPALPVPLPTHTHTHCANPCPYSPPVPSSLPTPVLLCTSAICTTLRAASHPASH